jgi:hypothetical protein
VYNRWIQKALLALGRDDVDARHIEAYMRLEHPTLDGLSASQFSEEVLICVACVDADGRENAERCARSFGL